MKPLTEELQRMLEQEAPKSKGQTWATAIAKTLLAKARKGDVRAIAEVANRVEGKAFQAIAVDENANFDLAERIMEGRKRVARMKTDDEIRSEIKDLQAQLAHRESESRDSSKAQE